MKWLETARGKQIRPPGDWFVSMWMAGRGFGKTRIGAEETWYTAAHPEHRDWRLAVIAPTQADLRKTVIEGESGLLARCPPELLLGGSVETAYNKSMAQLRFANGSLITGYSAEQPGRLRGPQHHFAWCDELAAWSPLRMQETWDMMMFGLRLGEDPRVLVTTTPQPYPLVYNLLKDRGTRVIRGTTYENADNLAGPFMAKIAAYEGTELGRQEIYADLVDLDSRAILKAGWWAPWREHRPNGLGIYPENPVLAFLSVDPAYTEDDANDPTGVTVWYVYADHYGNTRILLRYAWQERLEFPDLIARLKATAANFKVSRMVIENKASGLSIAQELRRQRPEMSIHSWDPRRADKVARAHRIAPMLKSGRVHVASKLEPGADAPVIIAPCAEVIEQCKLFPFSEHDDLVDSVTMALAYIRESGFELFEADAPLPPSATYRGHDQQAPLY